MPLEAAILPAEVNMLQYKHRLSILRSIDNLWYKHQLYYSLVLWRGNIFMHFISMQDAWSIPNHLLSVPLQLYAMK